MKWKTMETHIFSELQWNFSNLFVSDEPGCVNHDCADVDRCVDVRAPGTGYRCVS